MSINKIEENLQESSRNYKIAFTMMGDIHVIEYNLVDLLTENDDETAFSLLDGGIDQILDLKKGEFLDVKYRDSEDRMLVMRTS